MQPMVKLYVGVTGGIVEKGLIADGCRDLCSVQVALFVGLFSLFFHFSSLI
jgi:hypothetical protein